MVFALFSFYGSDDVLSEPRAQYAYNDDEEVVFGLKRLSHEWLKKELRIVEECKKSKKQHQAKQKSKNTKCFCSLKKPGSLTGLAL